MKNKDSKSGMLLLSFVSLCFAVACAGASHMTFSVSAGQIPPEFKGNSDTLLVIKHPMDMGYDKYLRRNFQENYLGPYKLIDANDLKQYPPEKYRYVFDNRSNYTTRTDMSSNHSFTYASSDKFFVTDRVNKKFYATESSAYYSKLMRAYVQALESERSRQ